MVEQFFSRYTNLYLNTICFNEILLSLHSPLSRKKTAIKLTYIGQQSSADPILSIITSSVFVCYKSYRFCESPAFSMFRELTIKIKLLKQYILHLLSEKRRSPTASYYTEWLEFNSVFQFKLLLLRLSLN